MSSDYKPLNMVSIMVGVLAAVGLAVFVLAMKMPELKQSAVAPDMSQREAAVAARIKPFGEVYLPGEATGSVAPPAQAAPEPVAAALTGPQVYNQACLACHSAGVGGAPILNDKDAWESRLLQGVDVLIEHAINGYTGAQGYMPPKGGRADLSDEDIAAAVRYMAGEAQ